jgi:hypothetical protein
MLGSVRDVGVLVVAGETGSVEIRTIKPYKIRRVRGVHGGRICSFCLILV